MNERELLVRIGLLESKLRILEQELDAHRHRYESHANHHSADDRPPFPMVPTLSAVPTSFPDQALFYDCSDDKLKIRVNGVTKATAALT